MSIVSLGENETDMELTFGDWLRSKRGMRGAPGFVTQEELARRMGVERTFVVQLENPKRPTPTYPTRMKIHAALGTTEDELIALGIVRGNHQAVRAVNEDRPSYAADAFIASLSRDQRALLRRLLDEADRPRPGDEEPPAETRRRHGT